MCNEYELIPFLYSWIYNVSIVVGVQRFFQVMFLVGTYNSKIVHHVFAYFFNLYTFVAFLSIWSLLYLFVVMLFIYRPHCHLITCFNLLLCLYVLF